MIKRLKDFKVEGRKARPIIPVLSMQFVNDESTKRIATYTTKHIIQKHKDELNNLAYK
ncbi:hypothetical protein [Acinetobacter sp. A47]|uniref:hypothetical protein n=1 Tax=Acinetobacter sp. A47 TaxID=1561217 RepID=UPI001488616A|nr:hypothetical protein [Acinetobacter sp. A47]